jgi:lactate permease
MLPDVLAGIISIVSVMIMLRYWKPASVWRFAEEPEQTIEANLKYTPSQVLRAWSPFIIMTLFIIAWGLEPVKAALNQLGIIRFDIPGLKEGILKPDGSPLVVKPFEFNFLSAPGTALLFTSVIAIPLMGLSYREGVRSYGETLKQLRFPIVTIASIVGFAFVANNAGMSITMALALASTGVLFPFFSPILGWLGVFLTGSDTSSNALFCRLQSTTADTLGVDPVVTVAANASGGVTGKMISPQSIAIGAAAVNLVGKESDLFRFTVKHSFVMLFIICVITTLQAYVMPWMIPSYVPLNASVPVGEADVSQGFTYLLLLAGSITLVVLAVVLLNKRKR